MITSEQLSNLAEEAQTNPDALAQLRAVTELDGQPINMSAIVDNAPPQVVLERVDTLVNLDITGTAQQEPEDFGTVLRPPSAGDGTFLAYMLIAALGIALLVVWLRTRQSRRNVPVPTASHDATTNLDTQRRTYADDARAAADDGDYATSVRLWFRWGLAAMEERGKIDDHTIATAGTLRESSGHQHASRVARDFDIVVYAERPATKAMVQDLEQVWSEIIAEDTT